MHSKLSHRKFQWIFPFIKYPSMYVLIYLKQMPACNVCLFVYQCMVPSVTYNSGIGTGGSRVNCGVWSVLGGSRSSASWQGSGVKPPKAHAFCAKIVIEALKSMYFLVKDDQKKVHFINFGDWKYPSHIL